MALFHAFAQLPTELQKSIWEAAVPEPSPTAYITDLTIQARHRNEDGSVGPNSKYRTHVHYAAEHGHTSSFFISTLSSLLFCCRAASGVAIAAHERHKLSTPMSLRGLRHEVDADQDLIVVKQGWQEQCMALPASVRYMAPPKPLHHLAVWFPGPQTDSSDWFYSFDSLMRLMSLWQDLRTLYVVVDPEYLHETPWIPEEDRSWGDDYDGNCLGVFLDTYKLYQSRHAPNTFYSTDRVYYEVEMDALSKAGGLEEVAEFLYVAQRELGAHDQVEDEDEEAADVKCMVLSWRAV